MDRKVLIAYDVSSNRRRQKVAHYLESLGIRVNKSVFICTISLGDHLTELQEKLKLIIGPHDCVFVLPLCKRCYDSAWFIERSYTPKSRRQRRTKIV